MATILCVDDEQSHTDLLSIVLEEEGFDVLVAHTKAEALPLIRTRRPDLIILDVMLPDADGFTALAAFRAVSQAPIVILTARASDEETLAGLALGAADYIVKPFRVPVLVDRINDALRGSRQEYGGCA